MRIDYVIDPGSVKKGNFHWVCSEAKQTPGTDISALATSLVEKLQSGCKVTLGVECVLFIPCPDNVARLGAARDGECTPQTGNKPFTACAGACATMTGLQALAWIFREIHRRFSYALGTTKWEAFMDGRANLFIWEAFVSGKEKGENHHEDALLALEAFGADAAKNIANATRVTAENPISLVASLILWAGLSEDVSLLKWPCIVIRPLPNLQKKAYV